MPKQTAVQNIRRSAEVLPFPRRPTNKFPAKPLTLVPLSGLQQSYPNHNEFAHYEPDRDETLDERQRMSMNLIAVAIVVTLIGVGVWIADSIQIAVKQEDCLLQGRTNCAPIELPAQR